MTTNRFRGYLIAPSSSWGSRLTNNDHLFVIKPNLLGLSLVRSVYSYCRDNLALVNVYMRKPVVTRIR